MGGPSVGDEIRNHPINQLDRNGQTHPWPGVLVRHRGAHADHSAQGVGDGSAGVAGLIGASICKKSSNIGVDPLRIPAVRPKPLTMPLEALNFNSSGEPNAKIVVPAGGSAARRRGAVDCR